MRRSVGTASVVGAGVILSVLAANVLAAVIGGTVQKVGKNSITLEQKSGGTKSFQVTESAEILVEGKKATLSQVLPGQTVSVTTSKQGTVTKISARGEGTSQAAETKPESPKSKPSKPEPKAQEPAVSPAETAETKKPSETVAARPSTGNRGPSAKRPAGNTSTGWTQYRGPNRENRSSETGLLNKWPDEGPPLAWSVGGLGEGYSSVSLSDDTIFTMGTEGSDEAVFALKLDGGDVLWTAKTGGGVFRDGNGNGPRGTPTLDGDSLYILGANGDLVCLNAATGKAKWSRNILSEFNARNPSWGICESVLIDGNQLICTPGGKGAAMVALNKNNGSTLWTCAVPNDPQAAYASAIIVEVGGIRQYVNFTHNSIIGVEAKTGKLLWGDDHSANGTANCSSPVAFNEYVFAASGYGKGGAAVRLTKAGSGVSANFLYHTSDMKNHHGGMVVLDGYVYGFDEGVLSCLDIKTGKQAWKNRSVGKGAVTYADGQLYCRSEGGDLALVEASHEGYRENGRFTPPDRSGRPAWAHPVVAAGKLFIRDQARLLAFEVKK